MKAILIIAALLSCCAAVYAITAYCDHAWRLPPAPEEFIHPSVITAGEPINIPIPTRPVYPHSVVPGGVETPEDLESAKRADPVVADHYQGLTAQRKAKISRPTAQHVSFRIGSKVCWTHVRVRIPEGEPVLLTDNPDVMVRERCGNQLRASLPSQMRVYLPWPREQAILRQMETPEAPMQEEARSLPYIPSLPERPEMVPLTEFIPPGLVPYSAARARSGIGNYAWPILPIGLGALPFVFPAETGGGGIVLPIAAVPTPESGTVVLFAIGLCVLAANVWRWQFTTRTEAQKTASTAQNTRR